MCSYKRVYYLDQHQSGAKSVGMGFVKLVPCESGKDARWTSICVDISGSIKSECEKVKLLLICAGISKMWGEIVLIKGKGNGSFQEPTEMFVTTGPVYLRICLEEGSYFECLIKEGECRKINEKMEENTEEAEGAVGQECTVDNAGADDKKEELEVAEVKSVHMEKDKWQQLWSVWPHIKPFEDKREYLRLELEDLVILPRQYYRLAENSFLLHGYHNYGHIVLAKVFIKGQEKICIGVPGNYYEKEVQVAVMFGFESFECETEPAKEGDFGYYMTSVAL